MTQDMHQRACLQALNARRDVAGQSLTDAALQVANLETQIAIEKRKAGIPVHPWTRRESMWFWGTVIVLVALTALIVWQTHGATLPADFVQAMKGVAR